MRDSNDLQILTVDWLIPDECEINDTIGHPVAWLGAYKDGSVDIELPNGDKFSLEKIQIERLIEWLKL